MSLRKARALIQRHKVFLIATHVNPEADGIGAELAFLYLLRKLGKKGIVVNESKVPYECAFLPGTGSIQPAGRKIKGIDCAVFLDCSEISRVGKVAGLFDKDIAALNIDHHFSNTRFARVNWVDARASCACEMVYRLCRSFKSGIDSDMALQLYSGIVADTGNFRYHNAGVSCHRIAAELIKTGVNPAKVYNNLFENNPFDNIKLLGSVLSGIKKDASGMMVWASIPRNILNHKFPSIDLAEITLSLLRSIKGVELAIVFKEVKGKKKQARLNFRSQNNFDCNQLASCFGGGGHRNASGAAIDGDFAKIKNKVLKRAQELLKEYCKGN